MRRKIDSQTVPIRQLFQLLRPVFSKEVVRDALRESAVGGVVNAFQGRWRTASGKFFGDGAKCGARRIVVSIGEDL